MLMLLMLLWQETAKDWHLIWYISAAFSLVAGTSFALFAGRSVTPRHLADTATTVAQSVELVPQSLHLTAAEMDKLAADDIDYPRPCVPLMTQDHAPPLRYVQDHAALPRYVDMAAAVNNHITRHPSLPGLSAAKSSQPIRATHSQVISIV